MTVKVVQGTAAREARSSRTAAVAVTLGPTGTDGREPALSYLPVAGPAQRLDVYRSGSVEVAFEGWIYDRPRLAEALELPEDAGDATLVAGLYERWGIRGFRRLSGAFAICIHDVRAGDVVAVRDRTGVVPLFHATTGGRLLVSPSVDALRRRPGLSARVDREMLATHLLTDGRDVGRSFYENVHRLLPGHALRVRLADGTHRVERYWSPLGDEPRPRWNDERDVERLTDVMGAAVGHYLELGRPGIYLSGGLDSGTVATVAADAARALDRPPPIAFSLVFDDPESNEEAVQRGVAGGLGLPQTLVDVDLTDDPLDAFHESLALNDDWPHPLASTFRSVYLSLGRRVAAEGCDLVLTGDGGDEWLAIHTRMAADLLRWLDVSELRTLVDTVQATHGLPRLRAGRTVLWEFGLRLLMIDAAAGALRRVVPGPLDGRRRRLASRRLPAWFAPDRSLREAVVAHVAHGAKPATSPSHYRHEILDGTLEHPLTLLYMEESFACGRRIGIPILKPFYHPDVVAFLARTPPHLRSRGGQFKGLLRTLLHARFPELGFGRQMKPYATNFNSTMVIEGLRHAGPGDRSFEALSDLGIVDGTAVATLVADTLRRGAMADRRAIPKTLWMLLCAERWVRSRREGA